MRIAIAAILTSILAGCCGCHTHRTSGPAAPAGASTGPPTPARTAAANPADHLDANGYIRQWLVLAPIYFGDNYDATKIDEEQIPGEAAMTPKAGDTVKATSEEGEPGSTKPVQKTLTWKPLVTSDFFFDLNEFCDLDTSEDVGGYAMAYLNAPQDMNDITFSLCSNDDGVVYLNGKKVYSFVGGRGLSEDADTVEGLSLHKGANVVIFKVWNDANAWQGCLRLLDKAGKPVTNVRVSLAK